MLHRKHINNGTHGNDVGHIHTNYDSCPWPNPFPLVRSPLPWIDFGYISHGRPHKHLIPTSKFKASTSPSCVEARANTHRHLLLSYRSAFPCRNICTQYFVFPVSNKWRCNFLLGLSKVNPTAAQVFLHPSRGAVWAFPKDM